MARPIYIHAIEQDQTLGKFKFHIKIIWLMSKWKEEQRSKNKWKSPMLAGKPHTIKIFRNCHLDKREIYFNIVI